MNSASPPPPPSATPRTAEATAADRSASDLDLRVPCYCEENVWRLAYRHLRCGRGSADRDDRCNNGRGDGAPERRYRYHVAFVSNGARCCPFFMQRAARSEDGCVCWDYHVIAIREAVGGTSSSTSPDAASAAAAAGGGGGAEILDVDTRLPYPCPLGEYLDASFPHARSDGGDSSSRYLPRFRVVPARQYLKYFYSDRMHMFKDGRWSSPPPDYEPIMNGLAFAEDGRSENISRGSNLEKYIDMFEDGSESSLGKCNDSDFEERWGKVYSLDQFSARIR
jgi:hypothetical protein